MPSVYNMKPAFQGLLRPLAAGLARRGATANQVTWAALVLSAAVGAAGAAWPGRRLVWLILPVFLFVRMALNAIDGMMAREHGQKSPFGAVLNETADILSDAALYLPFALLPGVAPAWAVAAVLAAWLAEFTGLAAVPAGASRRYDGPMGKSDRALVYGAAGAALAAGVAPGPWLNVFLGAVTALGLLTTLNRARAAVRECGRKGTP